MALIAQQLNWDWPGAEHPGEQKPKNRLAKELEEISNSPLTPAPSASTEEPLVTLTGGEPPLKKSLKASSMKDPESGLTMDTVKRRKLCQRYEKMFYKVGVWHRIYELPKLTNIQIGGLLRRSRNRTEMTDISEAVWEHVYEEKRRSDDRGDPDLVTGKVMVRDGKSIKEDDDASEPTDISDQEDDSKLSDILFDGMCGFGEADGDHKVFQSTSRYYEKRRLMLESDRWLTLLSRSLLERRSKVQGLAAREVVSQSEMFLNNSTVDSCARCIPIDKNYRRKLTRYVPAEISASTREQDISDLGSNLFSYDKGIDKYFEQLSMKLEEEDAALRAKLYSQHKDGILMVKNLNDQRRKQAQARAKEQAKRYAARVGRPLKNPNGQGNLKKKKLKKLRLERDALHAIAQSAALENVVERKSLEEQLHRLSSGYVYSEITVPQFRNFDLDAHEERAAQHLSRKSSHDSFNETGELPSLVLNPEHNEALYFGQIHHKIEFPRFSEEEMRRRRREKWLIPTPRYVPYKPDYYEHENPQSTELKSWTSIQQ